MKAGAYCTRNVVIVREEESALGAAMVMRHHHVGDVVIVKEEDGKTIPTGIITDRDIVIEIVAEQVDPSEVTVADLFRSELVVANKNDDLDWCIKQMKEKGVRRIPVVDEDESLLGILALNDIVEYLSVHLNNLVGLIYHQPEEERERTQ